MPGDRILLAHGEGARLSRKLVRDLLVRTLDNDYLRPMADGALLPTIDGPIVMSTDSYVVSPLIFPGGDIGKLAVHGTINDLAVSGAEPLFLSLALIIEEGLPIATLSRIISSIRDAAAECGTPIVTGDTKVVPRGAADGLFINTTGIGRLSPGRDLGPHRVRPGDCVLVSGTIGDHGMAILSARDGLEFESEVQSDTAPLHILIRSLLDSGTDVHFLRDATRGGVSAALHELTEASNLSVMLDEDRIPVADPVRGMSELLGLDPLYIANEGKFVAVVAAGHSQRALSCLHAHPLGTMAAEIGFITDSSPGQVLIRSPFGPVRVLDEPTGSPLPRIC